jgi:aryl-alcohol dehydrogenase-like predicted oxidoreductase
VVEAQWVAERRGRERFVTEQPPYSILTRGIEAELLPVCGRYGMGVLSWSPLAGGWLSGRFGRGKDNTSRRAERIPARYDLGLPGNQQKVEIVTALDEIADASGMSLVDLAIGFVLAHPQVTCPIVGPRTMEQLEPLIPAADIRLSSEVLDRIDELVAPGTNLNAADGGWDPPSVKQADLRRR